MAPEITCLDGATIVFDLDGTLVDSAADLMVSLNAVLAQEGLAPASLEATRAMVGAGVRALLGRGFAAAGRPLAEPRLEPLFAEFIAHYRAHVADFSRPFPGVAGALDALAKARARLAICTNKPTDLSMALLEAVGLAGRFAAVAGPDLVLASKPDPRHLIATIERAGGRLDRAVMVGDSDFDAKAARAAAVSLVLVDFGYSDIPAADLGADVLISHFDQLLCSCVRLLTPGPALSATGPGAIGPSPAGDA